MEGYIVSFIREDNMPDENYFYHTIEEASWHLHLFDNDDSCLYKSILLLDYMSQEILDKIIF